MTAKLNLTLVQPLLAPGVFLPYAFEVKYRQPKKAQNVSLLFFLAACFDQDPRL